MATRHRMSRLQPIFVAFFLSTIIIPTVIGTEPNDDFSSATFLESGVLVSGYVTESDGDNPDDKYQIEVSQGDTILLKITSDEFIDFCLYIGENGNEELDCYGEMNGESEINLVRRENTENYYVKIDCGSEAATCSSSAEYTLKITIHPDEAGDSLDDAADLPPEVRIEGWAALDEDANPLDFDYYRTPVMEGDRIRVVINSDDMTSYRIYDRYGIKMDEGYEEGNYDFIIPIDYDGDLFIELFCVQNYFEPCDYSLIAIGSTYVPDSDGDGVDDNTDIFPNDPLESVDSDGDGVGDNGDAFPNDANETVDSDGDEVGDNGDAFPNDANETTDTDSDGVGDNGDAFPNDANETVDSDGDGVGDNGDAFPNDDSETTDIDGDGVGDNADLLSSVSMVSSWNHIVAVAIIIAIIAAFVMQFRKPPKDDTEMIGELRKGYLDEL